MKAIQKSQASLADRDAEASELDSPNTQSPDTQSRPFPLEDLFYSTTNMRGFVTSCNQVFVRVSDYQINQLIGAPHSIVRHPDMPRAVFKILWDSLKAKKPLAAYVKNLAADGRYYWVMAVAIPVKDGYLSIRLKPSTAIQAVVAAEYRSVHALEHSLEADGLSRSKVLEQSVPALLDGLAKHGFMGYDAFQHVALPTEIASRRKTLGQTQDAANAGSGFLEDELSELALANHEVLSWISNLFANLDNLVSANEAMATRSRFLLELARNIHIFALNAGLSSSMLGAEGNALAAVTKELQSTSKEIVRTIEHSTSQVDHTIELIREVGFMISIATLQAEMVEFETQPISSQATQSDETKQSEQNSRWRATVIEADQRISTLVDSLAGSIKTVFDLSAGTASQVGDLSADSQSLFLQLDHLQFGLLAGRIEIARLNDRRGFIDMFAEISAQLLGAESEIKKFGEETASATQLIERFELGRGQQVLDRLCVARNQPAASSY